MYIYHGANSIRARKWRKRPFGVGGPNLDSDRAIDCPGGKFTVPSSARRPAERLVCTRVALRTFVQALERSSGYSRPYPDA